MKIQKVLIIIFIGFLLSNCSSEDSINDTTIPEKEINIEPIDLSKDFKNNETVIIEGQNFNSFKTIKIKINELNVKIVEKTDTQLTFEIPENATSGNLTLIFDGNIKNIGRINIDEIQPNISTNLFGFDNGVSPKKIIELNEVNGDIISELAVLPTNNIYFDRGHYLNTYL